MEKKPAPVAAGPLDVPLCVDLDGTVMKSDMLWESLLRLLRRNPFDLFRVLLWWTRGRACLKQQIAARTSVDPAALPYHEPFLDFLRAERSKGRRLLLVTASDRAVAEPVARHLGVFSEVLASDGSTNLRGKAKGGRLAERFGERGFDYAGNSSVDYAVWSRARKALVVNARPAVARHAERCAAQTQTFEPRSSFLAAFFKAIRPHQWVKNLIVFVPLLTAHKLGRAPLLGDACLAFLAFTLCAAGVYLFNDLLDLEADRLHPRKRSRPLASGDLPISIALTAAPLLLLAGGGLALAVSPRLAIVIGAYVLLTTLYSWKLKQAPLVDVFCLAGLYTIRLIGGHEATGVAYSFWLLVFSIFIFLSLALAKRFVELYSARQRNLTEIKGRGYAPGDLDMVATLGVASGYLSALVIALYVNSQEVRVLYEHPTVLLLVCPLLLFWISRVWMIAHRGQLHDDPIVFAIRDWASYVAGALTAIILWLATGK